MQCSLPRCKRKKLKTAENIDITESILMEGNKVQQQEAQLLSTMDHTDDTRAKPRNQK